MWLDLLVCSWPSCEFLRLFPVELPVLCQKRWPNYNKKKELQSKMNQPARLVRRKAEEAGGEWWKRGAAQLSAAIRGRSIGEQCAGFNVSFLSFLSLLVLFCSTGAHTRRPRVTKQGHRQDYCRRTLLLMDRLELELQQQRKKKKTLAVG